MNCMSSLARPQVLILGAMLLAVHPLASATQPDPTARERYLQERSACLSGHSHQPQDVCLREAGAAYDAARRGQLTAEDPAHLAANALARCDARPADQRELCERMVRGEGTVTGSVAEGGFVREIRVVIPAQAPAPGK